jgi:hypothetical protein
MNETQKSLLPKGGGDFIFKNMANRFAPNGNFRNYFPVSSG